MIISIVYAHPFKKAILSQEVGDARRVGDVIEKSGLLSRFPEIDLSTFKVGIYGKKSSLDQIVEPGDRIEVYVPITADPKKVKKRKKTNAGN